MTKAEEWSVEVLAVGVGGQVLDADRADQFAAALTQHAAVAYQPRPVQRRRTVQAGEIRDAIDQAIRRVAAAAEASGFPPRPVVPAIPALLGVVELAGPPGVTRQSASNLARIPAVPRPIAVLASHPVWAEPTIGRYIHT